MPKKTIVLLPETEKILEQMGLGSPSVAMGCYAAVLHALNYMDKDLLLVAKDDELGRKLQDLDLPVRQRAPRRG